MAEDLATLRLDVDARPVKDATEALNTLGKAGAWAEGQTNAAGKTWVRASSAAGQLRMAETSAAAAADKMAASTNSAGAAATKMAKEAQAAAAAATKVGGAGKLAGYQVQNLAYQMNDLVVGLASGQKPLTVFLQQGSQIGQIMGQARLGVFGLLQAVLQMTASFVAANPIILVVAAAAAVLATGIGLVTDEINKNSKVTVTWKDTLLGAFDVVSKAAKDEVTAAFEAMGLDIGEVWKFVVAQTKAAVNFMIGSILAVPKVIAATYDKIGPAFGDAFYSAANLAIEALNFLAKSSVAPLNFIIDGFNAAFKTNIPPIVTGSIDALKNPYAGAMGQLGAAGAKAVTSAFKTDYIGNIADAIGDAARARHVQDEAEKSGKDIGKTVGKAAGKQAGMSFAEAFRPEAEAMDAIKAEMERNRQVLAAKEDQHVATIRKWQEAGQQANAVTAEGIKIAAEEAERLNNQFRDMIGLLQNIGGLGSGLGALLGIASGNFDNLGNGQFGQLLSFVMNQQGKDGKKLGNDIKDALDGLFKDVFGQNGLFGKTLSETLQNAGLGIAGANAALGKQGAAGQIGSSLGGILGEKFGEKFLSKGLDKIFKGLGDFAGPLGAIAGGILGGLIGGLFGKTPKGTATINGIDITGNTGKGQQLEAANASANAIIDSLSKIASALGGTVTAVAGVSIGMRKNDYVLDPTGAGRTKGSGVINFGEDAQAAALAATKLLIERGVIGGIRASTQNILKAGTDLETQINKALAWENVLKEAEAASSPFAASLKELADQFKEINDLAIEAQASTAELAEVQALLIRKQQELIDSAMSAYRSTFFTDAENVAYAKSKISSTLTPLGYGSVDTVAEYKALVAATDALANPELFGALMDLTDEFGTLQDAADSAAQAADAAAAAEKALAQQRASINIQILQAQGKTAEALAAQRAAELAAADATIQPLLRQLYKAQDIASARDAVSEAYKRESSALQDTIDAADKAATSLREYRDSLTGTGNAASDTRQAMLRLMQIGGSAAGTGADALAAAGKLPGAGNDYLSALKNSAGSYLEYARGEALVKQFTNQALTAAEGQKTDAQRQLEQMTAQVNALGVNTDAVLSLADAIAKLNTLVAPASPSTPSTPGGSGGQGSHGGSDNGRDEQEQRRWDRQHATNTAILERLGELNNRWRNITSADGTGINIRADADLPITTVPAT